MSTDKEIKTAAKEAAVKVPDDVYGEVTIQIFNNSNPHDDDLYPVDRDGDLFSANFRQDYNTQLECELKFATPFSEIDLARQLDKFVAMLKNPDFLQELVQECKKGDCCLLVTKVGKPISRRTWLAC